MSHGAVQMITVKNVMKGLKARVSIVMFCLRYTQSWLKDVPVESKYARIGLSVARWVFVVYILLPGCVWLIMEIFLKCHVMLTCIALIAMLW